MDNLWSFSNKEINFPENKYVLTFSSLFVQAQNEKLLKYKIPALSDIVFAQKRALNNVLKYNDYESDDLIRLKFWFDLNNPVREGVLVFPNGSLKFLKNGLDLTLQYKEDFVPGEGVVIPRVVAKKLFNDVFVTDYVTFNKNLSNSYITKNPLMNFLFGKNLQDLVYAHNSNAEFSCFPSKDYDFDVVPRTFRYPVLKQLSFSGKPNNLLSFYSDYDKKDTFILVRKSNLSSKISDSRSSNS